MNVFILDENIGIKTFTMGFGKLAISGAYKKHRYILVF